MGAKTGISWTTSTWNPIRGCSRVSKGCEHCYAETQAARFSGPGMPYDGLITLGTKGPRWNGKVMFVPSALEQPLRWSAPRRIFVNSMSDLFHKNVTDEWLIQIFAVMALAQHHTFQVLTKRAKNMHALLNAAQTLKRYGIETFEECVAREAARIGRVVWDSRGSDPSNYGGSTIGRPKDLARRRAWPGWPLPNVWFGVSAEDQAAGDERIPLLLDTPAAVRFVSYEPAVGSLDVRPWVHALPLIDDVGKVAGTTPVLDWIIVGGESGRGARPFDIRWARDVVEATRNTDTACFVKQLGSKPCSSIVDNEEDNTLDHWFERLKDRKGGDINEWPLDLRVQEFPR